MPANTPIVELADARAHSVRDQIKQIQGSLKDRTFELADLLAESQMNSYHVAWGYPSFAEWIDASELDVKSRQAEYLIKIVTVAKELDIPRDQLRRVKISKLKAVFSLNPQEQGEQIKDLVKRAVNMPLDEVDQEVRQLKGLEGPKGTWRNFYFEEPAAAAIVDGAVEAAKVVAGSQMSDAAAIELICADFEADAHEMDKQQEEEINEA